MSKPLFFTGRKNITREDVAIRFLEQSGEVSRFEPQIDLSSYDLPTEAAVIVEAYHNAYLERFSVGTVASIDTSPRQLTDLEPGDRPHFRVKVIASEGVSGRLLAAIDEVRPDTEDDTGAGGALLPLMRKTQQEMGHELWRVHFVSTDERQPELWINTDFRGLFAGIQNQDPKITALIMPEILRQVLSGLVDDGQSWTDEGTLGKWLALAKEFHPDEFDPWEEEDRENSRLKRNEWVGRIVRQFAAKHRFFDRYHEDVDPSSKTATDD
jgi:hypothetical protein